MNDYKKNLNLNKTLKIITIISFFVLIAGISFQIYTSNVVALKGMDYKILYDKKEQLEKEIALLQYKDSTLSSLTYIEQKAIEQGFVKMTEPLNSIIPPPLASLNIQ